MLLCHASIDAGAKPGEYPNVAQLKYILDGASGTTVKVMALVKVVNPPAPQRESVVPVSKTGDVSGLLLGGVAVIFVFGCGGLLIRANRKGRR